MKAAIAGLLSLGATFPAAADEVGTAIQSSSGFDVVIVGEVHDNPQHHITQARFAGELDAASLVFEMFPESKEDDLNDLRGRGATDAEISALLDWQTSGWPDFHHYGQILNAVPNAKVFGAEVKREELRAAIMDGAAKIFGERASRFGLDKALPKDIQDVREAGQDDAHCNAMPAEMLPGMVEAQRLRDASLAAAVLRALDSSGGPVVVITGNGHARSDWGIPAVLDYARPDIKVFSVGQLESVPEDGVPFDTWLLTDPVERDDPCEAFRKS